MTKTRRRLLNLVVFVAIEIAVVAAEFGISDYWMTRPPPFVNVPADQDGLRGEFASQAWSVDIAAAAWNAKSEMLCLFVGESRAEFCLH